MNRYNSSTYKPGRCGSPPCLAAKVSDCAYCYSTPPKPGCSTNTCILNPKNTITGVAASEELSTDVVSFKSTAHTKTNVPRFIFSCSRVGLLEGLPRGASGMVGLGRTTISLPSQLSTPKFALCLPPKIKSKGVVIFGNPPYAFYPPYNKKKSIDLQFSYTKLYNNPVHPSAEYLIGVTGITIDKKRIPISPALLSINNKGDGGTKISTIVPFTVLESSIYNGLKQAFSKGVQAMNVSKVAPVAPFTECFSTEFLGYTPTGPFVPEIGFVFENKEMYWELYGVNSMVEISRKVVCLAFVDGGAGPRTSIVIGSHQLQDNVVEFDLAASRVGFSGDLINAHAGCDGFRPLDVRKSV
ncbi:hypothetical protein RJ639_035335 [Escallonia herrerae]|uniref:Peptidase A1 domain-containing protein n=1 Tax=Escallonia herrerae TaxID=1293975 RepID=A0AA88WUE5_9ASTE|nr:hypothetical protein RJ639_035335 [Escallonia herrerae]